MTKPNANLAIRFMPSLTDVAFLLPVIFLFTFLPGARHLLGDGDTGWHIRTGDWILANGRVPDKDVFSFTRPGQPWFAWEWLWDAAFAWLHQHGGMAAVVLASLLVICLTSALLYRLAVRKSGNILIAFGVTLLAAAGSIIHWLARPHLFTLLFVVIFYHILERVQDGNTRLLAVLPLLTILWANLHAGWLAGIMMIGAYAAGELLFWLVEPHRAALVRSARYMLCALGCFLASFLNPYFYQLHLHIYKYFRESFHFEKIAEFQSLNFHSIAAPYFECMLFLGAIAILWSVSHRKFAYLFLLLGWAHLSLIAARNIPIFLIVAAPPAAAAIQELLARVAGARVSAWNRKAAAGLEDCAAEYGVLDRIGRLHIASAAVIVLVAAVLYAPAPPEKFRAEYDPERYPTKAVEALRGAEFSKRIFTDDEWGDYLIYRLYPTSQVFVDGRSDFYGQSFEEKYLNLMNLKYDWESTLNRYHVETVLLSVNAPLASTLKESRKWRPVYDNGVAIVFRPSGANASSEAKQLSANGNTSGINRDCHIAKTGNRDPRITQHNP